MKKRTKDILFWGIIAIGMVLLLLFMVWIFEKTGIHVPGSREMWIGLIGAVIGGAFTMFGVLETIHKQEEVEAETRRLGNMPILGFQVENNGDHPNIVLTCCQGKLLTDSYKLFDTKKFCTIYVQTLNNACAFDFTIEGCAIDGKEISKSSAFSPSRTRIAINEKKSFAFDIGERDSCAFCVVRFSYKDIFGNKYFQELPFFYTEGVCDTGSASVEQVIMIRDIKQPVLVSKNVKAIEETAKEYMDYELFCKNPISGLKR